MPRHVFNRRQIKRACILFVLYKIWRNVGCMHSFFQGVVCLIPLDMFFYVLVRYYSLSFFSFSRYCSRYYLKTSFLCPTYWMDVLLSYFGSPSTVLLRPAHCHHFIPSTSVYFLPFHSFLLRSYRWFQAMLVPSSSSKYLLTADCTISLLANHWPPC